MSYPPITPQTFYMEDDTYLSLTDSDAIIIPAWIIVDLARWLGTKENVERLFGNTFDPRAYEHLAKTLGYFADSLETKYNAPITNRARDYSVHTLKALREELSNE